MNDGPELQPTGDELPLDAVGREHPGDEAPPGTPFLVASAARPAEDTPPGAVPKEKQGED